MTPSERAAYDRGMAEAFRMVETFARSFSGARLMPPPVLSHQAAPCGRAFHPDCSRCSIERPGNHFGGGPFECRAETHQHPGAHSGGHHAQGYVPSHQHEDRS